MTDLLYEQAVIEAARRDFPTFFALVMQELEPGNPYQPNWHIYVLADRLEAVRTRQIRRLMINQPPRSLKTQISSIAFCAWVLGHDPTRRIICLTYSTDVARVHAIMFNKVMRSDWYRRLFPHTRPTRHTRLTDWHTSQAGYRLGASFQGGVLSRGGDIIIIDDPNKGQEIYSELARQKVQTTYDHTISTRLNHPQESAIILVMQRLHPQDLAGHVLDQEHWEEVVIPATSTQAEVWDLGWGQTYVRKSGEVLQPDRMGPDELALKRRQMGLAMFEAQYQQRPIPQEGLVVKRSWLRHYDQRPDAFEFVLVSWDTASTLEEKSAWSVGTVWGVLQGGFYLLHVERDRLEAPDLRHRIEKLHRDWNADLTIVEDADLGRGIVQDLRRSTDCAIITSKPRGEKLARMQARAILFEMGKVFLPREAPWLATYLGELLAFPQSEYADQVDSTSQALDQLQHRFHELITPIERKRPQGRRRPQGAPLRKRQ